MSRKIKFHAFHILFRLFAFLADKSGGWRVFVRPKLLLGSVIVGLGLTACGAKTENNTSLEEKKDSISSKKDTSKKAEVTNKNSNTKSTAEFIKCYTGPVIKLDDAEVTEAKNNIENTTPKETVDTTAITCYIGAVVEETQPLNFHEDPEKVYPMVEEMPQFPGGDKELINFIVKNLKYPENNADIKGIVICGFIVNRDGSISDIKVLRSLEPSFDAEAIEVIKLLPKWIPGKQNGKIVRTQYALPIKFRVEYK